MVTKNGPPEPGTLAAIPGAIESLSALLAGELPCAFVDTLRAAGIHFTAAADARGTLALWEKDPLAIAISNDVWMVAALAGANFGVVMGLAAEPATMRAMIAAGAIDVIAPAADVAHIQERLSILAMRRANAAQPTRERGILDVVAVVSEVLSAGGVTAVEEALGLLGRSLSLDGYMYWKSTRIR